MTRQDYVQLLGERRTLQRMIQRGVNSPLTSSAGRLFDAVAAIANVRRTVSFEGQAAAELEWLAIDTDPDGVYSFRVTQSSAARNRDTSPSR